MEHGTEDACQEEAGEYTINEDVSSTVTLTESAKASLKGRRNGSIGGEISSDIHVGQDMGCLRGQEGPLSSVHCTCSSFRKVTHLIIKVK